MATNPSKCAVLPGPMESDLKKSLSMLDKAICGSSAEFVSTTETWSQPLTSVWDQLDSVIQWHLRHVSHLLQHLGSSNRFYNPSPDIDNDNNKSLLCINEDLLAMALNAQVCISPYIPSINHFEENCFFFFFLLWFKRAFKWYYKIFKFYVY